MRHMLARAALSGLISIVALSVAPAHSQPSGAGSGGLLSPAPLTGSGPERRFIPPDRSVAAPSSTATLPQEVVVPQFEIGPSVMVASQAECSMNRIRGNRTRNSRCIQGNTVAGAPTG